MTKTTLRYEIFLKERAVLFVDKIKNFWKRYKKNKAAVAGLTILIFLVIIAIFAPYIVPYNYYTLRPAERQLAPSREHLMGTDPLGRDVLSGIIVGSKISLLVGALVATITTVIGTLIGAIAGYYGGKIDHALNSIMQGIMIFPTFLLILLLAAMYGGSIWNVVMILSALGWAGTARLVRAQFLTFREREFVEAAKACGASPARIIFFHILPNAIPPAIVNMSFSAASAILTESSLSFLGLGDPNVASWGMMLNTALSFMRVNWWMVTFPGLAIFVIVAAFNLIGDGVNDAINPRLKER